MKKTVSIQYLAGLFDGEGCVTMSYGNKGDIYRAPVVSIRDEPKGHTIFLISFYYSPYISSIEHQDPADIHCGASSNHTEEKTEMLRFGKTGPSNTRAPQLIE